MKIKEFIKINMVYIRWSYTCAISNLRVHKYKFNSNKEVSKYTQNH